MQWADRQKGTWQVIPSDLALWPSMGLQSLAASSLLVWALILPCTQPEQQRRYRVERALRRGEMDVALSELAAHPREAYPPHWRPPPGELNQLQGREPEADLVVAVLEESTRQPTPEWVREHYMDRLWRLLEIRPSTDWDWLERVADLLVKLPGGMELLNEPVPEERFYTKYQNLKSLRRLIKERHGDQPKKSELKP
jgi:hypothetical protein